MRNIVVTLFVILALGLFAVFGYAVYQQPVDYICIDINPCIELGVNIFNRVMSIQAVNEDGIALLEEQEFIHLNVRKAIKKLVILADENQYIADDGSSIIAVTAESTDFKKAERLLAESEKAINDAAKKIDMDIVVYKDFSDTMLRKEAYALQISPGKLKLIKLIQALDPATKVEKYKDHKVSEIINDANSIIDEKLERGYESNLLSNSFDKIKEAFDKKINNMKRYR